MQVQIITNIVVAAQGLILVQNYYLHMESWGGNVLIFVAGMSSSVHIHNKEKDISFLGEGPIQGLDDITSTAEAIYAIGITQLNKRIVLS